MKLNIIIACSAIVSTVLLSTSFVHATNSAPTQIIAIGDTGKDNPGQAQVAGAIAKHCSQSVCNFGLLAGDNIYDEGMTSVTDPILESVFRKHYERLQFPFVVALGNHDYGKRSNQWERGAYQLEYAKKNPQYFLPNYFYYLEAHDYVLVVLDTTRMMWTKDLEAQEQMLLEAHGKAKGKWFVVLGHHPYLSNGRHGNAGNYEGVSWPPFISGRDVKTFIERNVCGKAHVYISGHDHNLQLTDGRTARCNTLLAVTGSGASTTKLEGRNPTLFQADKLGFMALTITGHELKMNFIDSDNAPLFEHKLSK